jgi:hypothetical protein
MSATITRAVPSGAWIISDMISGYLVTRTYYGHTKRDALRLFREEFYDTCDACGRDDSEHGYIKHRKACANLATVSA